MTTKKTTKKSVKKVVNEEATYNEYGVCIDCQGGDPSCHHNNLVDNGGKVTCVLCGYEVN